MEKFQYFENLITKNHNNNNATTFVAVWDPFPDPMKVISKTVNELCELCATVSQKCNFMPKFHQTGPTRLCRRPGSTTWSPTKSDRVRSGLRQVRGLCLVVDIYEQSRHVRILSVGPVGSQTQSVGPCSGIWKRHDTTRPRPGYVPYSMKRLQCTFSLLPEFR